MGSEICIRDRDFVARSLLGPHLCLLVVLCRGLWPKRGVLGRQSRSLGRTNDVQIYGLNLLGVSSSNNSRFWWHWNNVHRRVYPIHHVDALWRVSLHSHNRQCEFNNCLHWHKGLFPFAKAANFTLICFTNWLANWDGNQNLAVPRKWQQRFQLARWVGQPDLRVTAVSSLRSHWIHIKTDHRQAALFQGQEFGFSVQGTTPFESEKALLGRFALFRRRCSRWDHFCA